VIFRHTAIFGGEKSGNAGNGGAGEGLSMQKSVIKTLRSPVRRHY